MADVLDLYADRLRCTVGAARVERARDQKGENDQIVVHPGAATEVTDVLRVAEEMGARVGVRDLPHDAKRVPIIVDLSRMRQVLHLDETSLLCTVQAGVTAGALEELLGRRNLTLGPLPTPSLTRTIGALLSVPRPSEARPRLGRFIAACAGVSAILGDGTELSTRVAPRKATGPDLLQALLGSHATLGILTSATLRIARRGEAHAHAAGAMPSLEAAARAARALLVDGARPLDIVLLNQPNPTLAVTFDGPAPLVEAERALASRLAHAHGGRVVPHLPPPLMMDAVHEEALTHADLIARAESLPGAIRVGGWHRSGCALLSLDRAPSSAPAPHAWVAALKQKLDPHSRLAGWATETVTVHA